MTLAGDLERAHAAGAALARPGERVAAVLPAEPAAGMRVYVVALAGDDDDDLAYVALAGDLRPLDGERLVRDAVSVLAMAEAAEEASGATHAEETAAAADAAAGAFAAAGMDEAAAAAADLRAAVDRLVAATAGPRVASPGYLDAVATAARALDEPLGIVRAHAEAVSRRLSGAPDDPLEPLARAAWAAVATATRAGEPALVPGAVGATTGAAEALADDVLRRLRGAAGGSG